MFKDHEELFKRFLEISEYLDRFLILVSLLGIEDVVLVEGVQWAARKTHEAMKNAK